MERPVTTVEKMLGGRFSGDPRLSRFPLPELPEGAPLGVSYTHSGFILTPEMAKDWVMHRTIRRDLIPKALMHDEVIPNRKYLVAYAKTLIKNLQKPNWWNKGTHQGLAFTRDGFTLDGQHRILACALSGVPIILPLSIVPWSAYKDIDQNRHRSPQQMIDLPYANQVASIARHLIPVLEGTTVTDFTANGREYAEQVIEIALGWPVFAEDQPWMREIVEASSACGAPIGPLGAAVVCILASEKNGKAANDAQQFLNGLRPLSRDVEYITIGKNGKDPRRLLAAVATRERRAQRAGERNNAGDQRSMAAVIRHAVNIWMLRHDEKRNIQTTYLSRWPESRDLPSMWREDAVREYHDQFVN